MWGLAAAWLLFCAPAFGAQTQLFDTVRFQVESAREVANDRMRATMAAQATGSDPSTLAEEVNRAMAWALARVPSEGVTAETLDYQSFPVGERPLRWRVVQSLELESADAAALSELIGRLQEKLTLNSLTFSVSESRRRGVEEELIAEGLKLFSNRAQHITSLMDAKGYRLVTLEVVTPQSIGPIPLTMEAREAVAPAVRAGTTRLGVVIAGTVQLQREISAPAPPR